VRRAWTFSGEAQALYLQIKPGQIHRRGAKMISLRSFTMRLAHHMMPKAAEKPIIPHKVKPQTQTKIMAKTTVKSKAAKPAPKKAAAKKVTKKK
jgi:hypothetical protein